MQFALNPWNWDPLSSSSNFAVELRRIMRERAYRHRWWPREGTYTGMKRAHTCAAMTSRFNGLVSATHLRTLERSRRGVSIWQSKRVTKGQWKKLNEACFCLVNQSSRDRLVPFTPLLSSGKWHPRSTLILDVFFPPFLFSFFPSFSRASRTFTPFYRSNDLSTWKYDW